MTPEQGVIWWRNSSLHYRMMVSQRYMEAGVGFATNGVQNMYVLVMGRPSNQPLPAAAPAEPETEPLMVTPIELAEPREDGSIVHVVQEGQALWQIAAHYKVKLPDLLLYNGLEEDDFLQPGDEIIVRLADDATPPPTPTPPLIHVVREGDNIWIIAARYGVERATLFYLNGLSEDDFLQPGTEIKLRLAEGETPPPTPTPKLIHVVREGETAWTIAARNGLTLDELLAFNGLAPDAVLHIGDELYVRATFTPTPAPTATAPPQAELAPTATLTSSAEFTPTAVLSAAAVLPDAAPNAAPSATPLAVTVGTPTPVTTAVARDAAADDGLPAGVSVLIAAVALLLFAAAVWRHG
jgi:LysM repeat protein